MKRNRMLSLVLALTLCLGCLPPTSAAEDAVPLAHTTVQKVDVDGKTVEFQMCSLADENGRPTNYIKARDLACVFDGTGSRFEVAYDPAAKAVDLLPGRAYTPNGFELEIPFSGDQPYVDCTGTTCIDGKPSKISTIRLTDEDNTGHTFYALRELCWELGASVGWDYRKGVTIETGKRPEPVYDYAPAPCEAIQTIDGEIVREAWVMNKVHYLRLPEEGVYTSQPCGKKSPRGTDYYAAEALYKGRTLRFDNNERRITCGSVTTETEATALYDGKSWYLPLRGFYRSLGYADYYDEEEKHYYFTFLPGLDDIPKGYSVPILMYHAVSDDIWGGRDLFVSPLEMEKQLKYLSENGFTTIFFSDLPNIASIEKPVMLTFDDGYEDNYTQLFPLLKKYNCKATIFMIVDCIGVEPYLSFEQLQEMTRSGLVQIESHTMSHPKLDTIGEAQTVYEMEASQRILARGTGRLPYVVCYPYGRQSELTRRVAANYYQFGLLMSGGRYTTGSDRFLIPRCYIARDTGLGTFAAYVS